jgi:hypothetical protein
VKTQLAAAQQELMLQRHAEKLLELLPAGSPVPWRKVCRKLHAQAKPVHKAAIDYLVAAGRIVQHPDGLLERLTPSKSSGVSAVQ